jgi:hypothetical protein
MESKLYVEQYDGIENETSTTQILYDLGSVYFMDAELGQLKHSLQASEMKFLQTVTVGMQFYLFVVSL